MIKDEYQFASVEEQAEFIRIVQNAINNNSKNFLARLKEVAKEVREECEKEWPADGQHWVVFLGRWPTGTGRPALTGAYDLSWRRRFLCIYICSAAASIMFMLPEFKKAFIDRNAISSSIADAADVIFSPTFTTSMSSWSYAWFASLTVVLNTITMKV